MSTDKNNLWIETEDGLFVDPAPALQSEMNRVLEGWEKRIEQAQECAGTQNKVNNSERSELKDAALAAVRALHEEFAEFEIKTVEETQASA